MALLTRVPVFDADDRAGIFSVRVYDTETEVIDDVKQEHGIAGMAGPGAAILCYVDDNGRYRGEMRQEGQTKAVCDADDVEALAKWLRAYSHNCKG